MTVRYQLGPLPKPTDGFPCVSRWVLGCDEPIVLAIRASPPPPGIALFDDVVGLCCETHANQLVKQGLVEAPAD